MEGTRQSEVVRLFAHEPELLQHVPSGDAEVAERRVVVTCLRLPRGELHPPAIRADPFDLGFLVLEGLLVHRLQVMGRRASELLGPGDVIRPWRSGPDQTIAATMGWEVSEPTRIAILDRRFEQEVSRLPGVVAELMDRVAARAGALSIQLALTRLPRLEDRLLTLFWHLAERFGRVDPDGVTLQLRLSQETLAELTSARRQSVSSALGRLRDRGVIVGRSPGRWLLRGDPPDVAAAGAGDAGFFERLRVADA